MSPMFDIFVQHLEQSGVSDRSAIEWIRKQRLYSSLEKSARQAEFRKQSKKSQLRYWVLLKRRGISPPDNPGENSKELVPSL